MKATSSKPFAPRRYNFTADDLRRFRHQERMSWGRIARKYGCHHSTLIYACRRLGVPVHLELRGPA